MSALADAAREPGFGVQLAAVISDKDDAPGLAIAQAAGVPTAVVRPRDFSTRELWDEALARTVAAFDPALVVLAGFMRIVGAPLLDRYPQRIINTHPSLLPAYPGAHAVRDALAAGESVAGCSVIIVDAGVDTGPLVAQEAVAVLEGDTEEVLHERIKTVERRLLVQTVRELLTRDWTVASGRVIWSDEPRDAGEGANP